MTDLTREMVWWVPEGGAAVMRFPEQMSATSIDELEQCCALMFRGLRRSRLVADRQEAGAIEFESWAALNAASSPAPTESK